jgi:hypothetical protein
LNGRCGSLNEKDPKDALPRYEEEVFQIQLNLIAWAKPGILFHSKEILVPYPTFHGVKAISGRKAEN